MIKGDRLKALRKAKNLTQGELGEMIGVKKSVVCLYEKELRNPSIEAIIDFVHIFGVSADYILGTDCKIKTVGEDNYYTLTKEELKFIDELKKYKDIYDILIPDTKRGVELLKNKIG